MQVWNLTDDDKLGYSEENIANCWEVIGISHYYCMVPVCIIIVVKSHGHAVPKNSHCVIIFSTNFCVSLVPCAEVA